MSDQAPNGLIHAALLDGEGGARDLDWPGVRAWSPASGPLWVHLDRTLEGVQAWLRDEAALDPSVCEALLSSSTRPRYLNRDDGLLLTLRGVNLAPGADPADMISIRIWVEAHRIISLRRERIVATEDVHATLAKGRGPRTAAALMARIVHGLNDRMAPILDELGERLDDLEDAVVDPKTVVSRSELPPLRHQIIALRRFLAPQRQAMAALGDEEETELLSEADRGHLRESANRLSRYVEDLDAARDRAMVIQDELATQMAERLSNRIYVLTVIAAVVLPLSLLASMFGMNLGGIPGSSHPAAFAVASVVFGVLAVVLIVGLRKVRWL